MSTKVGMINEVHCCFEFLGFGLVKIVVKVQVFGWFFLGVVLKDRMMRFLDETDVLVVKVMRISFLWICWQSLKLAEGHGP